jgi:L-cysteine S-thiosulfotransferase
MRLRDIDLYNNDQRRPCLLPFIAAAPMTATMFHRSGPAKWLPLGAALTAALLSGSAASAQSTALPGQALAFDRNKGNCLTCHDIRGGDSPGNVGPSLADMKKRFPERAELAAIIFDETKRNPLTVMPPFGRNLILTNQEIESIIDFLYTR